MEATEIPDSVYAFCKKFMDKLDLKFGAFDFIVNHDHEWVFLEVNESGQFLFMEMADQSLNILSAFCHFLSNPYATEKEIERHASYADILKSERYKEFI
ncbi:hypothetical protein A7Q26_07685 [Sphingobium sp. TCM1]|nr:hypothetical protein A7Q26_07685 [Sphingobium sp. TCM1]